MDAQPLLASMRGRQLELKGSIPRGRDAAVSFSARRRVRDEDARRYPLGDDPGGAPGFRAIKNDIDDATRIAIGHGQPARAESAE